MVHCNCFSCFGKGKEEDGRRIRRQKPNGTTTPASAPGDRCLSGNASSRRAPSFSSSPSGPSLDVSKWPQNGSTLPDIIIDDVIPQAARQNEDGSATSQEEQLINLLLDLGGESVSVITILGAGGGGKTHLAHCAYNDDRVVKHFHARVWVCASDNLVAMKNVVVHPVTNHPSSGNPQNLDILKWTVEGELKGRRFLLVLDGAESLDWTALRTALQSDVRGCKIILTAQEDKMADEIAEGNKIIMRGFKTDEFHSFFEKCAFGDEDPINHVRLQAIGKDISEKLNCSPLAAKVLGGLLRGNFCENHWLDVLNSKLWDPENALDSIMPALFLSYQYLPEHLRQCFTYCSVFPKGYSFDGYKLVNIWMAQGFIQADNLAKRSEDIGMEYFNQLLSLSFFERPIYTRSYGAAMYYLMPNMLHDLAKFVSKDECFIYDGKSDFIIPPKTRHLSLTCWTNTIDRFEWSKLQTLLINTAHCLKFESFGCIKVLDLSYSHMTLLPDAIGGLMNLRYLDLAGNDIASLPEALCNLHLLQTLVAPQVCNQLPSEISNLINLRHLIANDTALSSIAEIGMLTCLQELKEFQIKAISGHNLGQLKDMAQLRGMLCISNLNLIQKKEEAINANIHKKLNIKSLHLKWRRWKGMWDISFDTRKPVMKNLEEDETQFQQQQPKTTGSPVQLCEHKVAGLAKGMPLPLPPPLPLRSLSASPLLGCPRMQEEVLEFLRPPSSLVELEIHWYRGSNSPSWLTELYLHDLQFLHLRGCENWQSIPPLGQFPFLKKICMSNMNVEISGGTKEAVVLFPSLEELCLEDMLSVSFEELPVARKGDTCKFFSCLRKLFIRNCIKVKGLPPICMLAALEELDIKRCPELESELPRYLKELPSLSILKLSSQNLTFLPEVTLQRLKVLEIESCPNLKSWLAEQEGDCHGLSSLHSLVIYDTPLPTGLILEYLTSLEELKIDNCSELKSFTNEQQMWFRKLTLLQDLRITGCKKLKFLPTRLHTLSSLEKLTITDCPMIKSLPARLPTSLKKLDIWNCAAGLTSEWLETTAPDWVKNIPYKTIG